MATDVTDQPDRSRYELTVDGTPAGHVNYRVRPDAIDLIHTEVYDAFSGHGLGNVLAKAVLDDVRARGLKMVPTCPFIADYVRAHAEYHDLIVGGHAAASSAALAALDDAGVAYRLVRHTDVRSVEEAAAQAGVDVPDVIKTIVVRRGADDYVFVLVPGDRAISWPKLRTQLGVNRLSLPDATEAKTATGYERGTITPFGATIAWPVVADERVAGHTIRLGAGARDTAVVAPADAIVLALSATVADVTDPAPDRG